MIIFATMNPKLRHTLRLVSIVTVAVLCYTAFFQTMYCWMVYGDPIYDYTLAELSYSLLLNYIPILVLALLMMVVCSKTVKIRKHWKKMVVDAIAGAVLLVIVNVLFALVTGMSVNWGGTIFNCVLVWLGIEYWSLSVQKREALVRENLLQQDNLRMKYEVLQSYVNPHFLYNSLDMLCSLIEDDMKEKAEEFIFSLSNYYRQMTRHISMPTSTFAEELSMVRRYIDIMKYHYDNCLELIVEGVDDPDMPMVPFSLQLLVENVLKHNQINSNHPMRIVITVTDSDIVVSNPVNLKPALSRRTSTGLGLSYLRTLYGYHGQEVLIETDSDRFTVRLPQIA